jgi:hypothetical protein
MTLVVHFKLRIYPWTFEKIQNSPNGILRVCREGLFLLPYNELAVAQGPKIYQKKAL